MPVFPPSSRAETPLFELAETVLGTTRPEPINFRTSMLPIDTVPVIRLIFYKMVIRSNFGDIKKE